MEVEKPSTLVLGSGNVAENWRKWKRRFEIYLEATGLVNATAIRKCATFKSVVGDDGLDVMETMDFRKDLTANPPVDETKQLDVIIAKFDAYCMPRKNVTVERFAFHSRKQASGEPVDVFITDLKSLASTCEFGELKNSLIKDQIVLGIHSEKLRATLLEKGGGEKGLSLEDAVSCCKLKEVSEGHLKSIVSSTEVAGVQSNAKFSGKSKGYAPNKGVRCKRCGKSAHKFDKCPATDSDCRKCGHRGHWAAMCISKTNKVNSLTSQESSTGEFLGEVSSRSKGKRSGGETKVRVVSGIFDKTVHFKIDTGAGVTVVPPMAGLPSLNRSDMPLFGPGKTSLTVLGCFQAELSHNNESVTSTVYVVKGQEGCLLSKGDSLALSLVEFTNVDQVSNSYPGDAQLYVGLGLLKGRQHTIQLREGAEPFAIYTARPIPIPQKETVENELRRMEADGVIRKVMEPTEWTAPMVVVPKANGKVRICADFTKLNKAVKREVHPMSAVSHSLAQLSGGRVFSKVDANSGYWQIALAPESQKLTTFLSPLGRYCYQRLPQGLSSAPEVFSKEMSVVMDGLDSVVVHMDDLLVWGKDRECHDRALDEVLRRIHKAGMTLNPSKCMFRQSSVKFLGRIVDAEGIHADQTAIESIMALPPPTCVKELQSFLGAVNQYSEFSSSIAELTHPLRELLRKNVVWMWDQAQQSAFEDVKKEIARPACLAQFNTELPTIVTTDASGYGMGATLSQVQKDGSRRLVAAASRSLTDAERRYACIERECLCIAWAVEKFRMYVTGLVFTIETDHKPLIPILMSKDIASLSPRLQRFRLRLKCFEYTVSHIAGKNNQMADLLSRRPQFRPTKEDEVEVSECREFEVNLVEAIPASERRLGQIRQAQLQDEVCLKVREYCGKGWPKFLSSTEILLKPYWVIQHELTVVDDLLLRGSRLVIPSQERLDVLEKIHTGHLGITKCRARAKESVWWPGISDSIEQMVKRCNVCKENSPKPTEPLLPTEWPQRPWEMVASDLFEYSGRSYLLVVDYHSRYPEIARLENTSSATVINHLKSIFARHGIPSMLRSDNGPQYASREFALFAEEYDFTHVTSSPRYPQANGEAERMVRTVKALFKKGEDPYLALLAYRNTALGNGKSPAELLMGRSLRTNLPSVPKVQQGVDEMAERERVYRQRMKTNHDERHKAKALMTPTPGTEVLVRDMQRYGTVTDVSDRSVTVQTPRGTVRRNQRDLVTRSAESGDNSSETASKESRPLGLNDDEQGEGYGLELLYGRDSNGDDSDTDGRRKSERKRKPPERFGWE